MAIVGGTGALGFGLALRLGAAGTPVVIGSRDGGRAQEAAEQAAELVPHGTFSGAGNEAAAADAELVVLSVPFRSQSETLTNLKGTLHEGQILVDATVPLAAAVSGKATRLLGVWQGSAAQQAQEMAPEGVHVVSALHTVSAALLARPRARARRGRPDVRRPAGGQGAGRGAPRADRGPAGGRLRPARDGAHRRGPDPTDHLDQRPSQDPGRHPDHGPLSRPPGPVVVLAGGTGGAKLARGMLDVVGAAELVVIANPGDDVEIYGAYVSPDPDLVTFWLGDRIDARGWGIEGDTFAVMDGLRELGVEVWFNLGDRDLALGLERARMLAAGATPTAAHRTLSRALGVGAAVLPATDHPLRTWITAGGRPWPFQEFMIRHRAQGPIDDVAFRGAAAAQPTPEVLEAIRGARAIIIGPSNPIISIGPILAIPGLRDALRSCGGTGGGGEPAGGRRGAQGPDRRLPGVGGVLAGQRRDPRCVRRADRRPGRR